jgi:hypothetical protein
VRDGSAEGVLHLLAGLLEVGLALVTLALAAHLVVAGGSADALLGVTVISSTLF